MKIPKYINCNGCGIADFVTQDMIDLIKKHGLPKTIECPKCQDYTAKDNDPTKLYYYHK